VLVRLPSAPPTTSVPALTAGLAPHVGDSAALTLAAGIIGATVMPHVVYAHSALQVVLSFGIPLVPLILITRDAARGRDGRPTPRPPHCCRS
jgi:hypothetical protein